jgi:mannose-6-phosphate isomerase-like protein (cupin superfamily)
MPSIRNIVETPWQQYPGHFGGALLRRVQEQIYHVLDGEGAMEIDGKRQIVRRHDVIFIPPGVPHSIRNEGLGDLTFIVVTTPAEDR